MPYEVHNTKHAEDDLVTIWGYIIDRDSSEAADYVLDHIDREVRSLKRRLSRGQVPKQLERLGVGDFLQVHWTAYRIIYRILERDVFVHCVLAGRRDMQTVLQPRLLR